METTEFANNIFEQPWWLDIVAPGQWFVAVVEDNQHNTIARLPYVKDRHRVFMPPFTQTLGPWIAPEYRQWKRGNKQLNEQKEIIYKLLEQLKPIKSVVMYLSCENSYVLPYHWQGYKIEPTFSYRLTDLSDIELLKNKFSKTVGQNIRSAMRKIRIEESKDARTAIALIKKTFKKQKREIPYSEPLVERIISESIKRNNGKLYIAYGENNIPWSCVFLLYDEKICYYLFGGTDPDFSSTGVQTAILWQAIQFSSTVSQVFDFEGSNIEGIENFVRQFGGQSVTNYYVEKRTLWLDLLSILKPRIKQMMGYKS